METGTYWIDSLVKCIQEHGREKIKQVVIDHGAIILHMPIRVEPMADLERGLVAVPDHVDGPYILDFRLSDLIGEARVLIRHEASKRAWDALGLDQDCPGRACLSAPTYLPSNPSQSA